MSPPRRSCSTRTESRSIWANVYPVGEQTLSLGVARPQTAPRTVSLGPQLHRYCFRSGSEPRYQSPCIGARALVEPTRQVLHRQPSASRAEQPDGGLIGYAASGGGCAHARPGATNHSDAGPAYPTGIPAAQDFVSGATGTNLATVPNSASTSTK